MEQPFTTPTERQLHDAVWNNPNLLEANLTKVGYEVCLPSGRVDCLFKDVGGTYVAVECAKEGPYNERQKVAQILGYVADLHDQGKQARGILVGEKWASTIRGQAALVPTLKVIQLKMTRETTNVWVDGVLEATTRIKVTSGIVAGAEYEKWRVEEEERQRVIREAQIEVERVERLRLAEIDRIEREKQAEIRRQQVEEQQQIRLKQQETARVEREKQAYITQVEIRRKKTEAIVSSIICSTLGILALCFGHSLFVGWGLTIFGVLGILGSFID